MEAIINGEIRISQRFNLPYILDRGLDAACKDQLKSLISRMEIATKEKERHKALEKANQPSKSKRSKSKSTPSLDRDGSSKVVGTSSTKALTKEGKSIRTSSSQIPAKILDD